MAHTHPINDTDTHFKIDGITRLVKNVSETKAMLVQYDHNSEKFTFEVPRKVDDHDLSLCNIVRVHYINIDKSKRTENKGVCDITETLAICPEDNESVICSWLISSNATQLVGSLYFVIQFACIEGDKVLYSWNTARHTGVSIIDGIDNGKDIDEKFLADWEQRINDTLITSVTQTAFSDVSEGENVYTFTFGDGSTSDFVVKNGSRGEKSLVGSIETISGEPLHFWFGTQAEYNDLTERQRKDCFCIITDARDSTDYAQYANQAIEDRYGNKFVDKYLHETNNVYSGDPYNNGAVTIMALPESEGGTYYHAVLKFTRPNASTIVYDFGILRADDRNIIVSPMITLASAVKESHRMFLGITPTDSSIDRYQYCEATLWVYDMEGNKVDYTWVDTILELTALNDITIGE